MEPTAHTAHQQPCRNQNPPHIYQTTVRGQVSPPSKSHDPSCLVIQFPPDRLHDQDKKDPQAIVSAVNAALGKNPTSRHLRVVAVKINNQGNLILSTRADQTAAELLLAAPVFIPIIDPNNLHIEVREDKKWSKIQIDGVSTTAYTTMAQGAPTPPTPSNCNPSYASAPGPAALDTHSEELRAIPRSSVVFAVDDESVAKNILHNYSLALFGRHCSLRAYQDRPPVIQCKCWGWNHKVELCKNPPRSRLCSKAHTEAEHVEPACSACSLVETKADMTMKDGNSCLYNLRCTIASTQNMKMSTMWQTPVVAPPVSRSTVLPGAMSEGLRVQPIHGRQSRSCGQ